MIHAQPEEQQGTKEQRLEEVIQHPWEPAVHQEGEREERVWKAEVSNMSKNIAGWQPAQNPQPLFNLRAHCCVSSWSELKGRGQTKGEFVF